MNDEQQRGRALSAGRNAHLTSSASASTSASPHPHAQAHLNNTNTNTSYQQSFGQPDSFNPQFASSSFHQQDTSFLNPQATLLDFEQQFQASGQPVDIAQHTFLQAQANINTSYPQSGYNHTNDALSTGFTQPVDGLSSAYNPSNEALSSAYNPSSEALSPNSGSVNLNVPSPYSNSSEASSFPNFDLDASNQALNPSLLYADQSQQQSFDPSSLSLDPMAAATHHSPTPPHLLHANMHTTSQSPSPNASPGFRQLSFNDSRPRSESLDPASAAFPPQGYHGNDWANGRPFQGHRRTPSDAYSDISSHSAQASPYLGATEDFDASPMLNAQDPAMFTDALGLGQFTLSDSHLAQPHISPIPSPHHSPNLMPQQQHQQPLPDYTSLNNFGFSSDMVQQNGANYDNFQSTVSEPFPNLPTDNSQGDFGQADIMSPPEINIDFAPPSRQASFGPPQPGSQEDTLSPPDRSKYIQVHTIVRSSFDTDKAQAAIVQEQSQILLPVVLDPLLPALVDVAVLPHYNHSVTPKILFLLITFAYPHPDHRHHLHTLPSAATGHEPHQPPQHLNEITFSI